MIRDEALPGASRNIYVGTGIHGDEPSGPLAVIELVDRDPAAKGKDSGPVQEKEAEAA